MSIRINPFHELYVGESIGPEKFVGLFSNVIVEHAHSLFQPGNVVLKGLPGSGKSMLLNLLKPSVRIAYQSAKVPFPVPHEFSNFIGAGINLLKSGIKDIGHWPTTNEEEKKLIPYYFADFLNYWVIDDLFSSIDSFNDIPSFKKRFKINNDSFALDSFALTVGKDACWNGYLTDVRNFQELRRKIQGRISQYRELLSLNIPDISVDIKSTKTVIGQPIAVVADTLKRNGIVDPDVEFFVRIDQYEELAWLDNYFGLDGFGTTFQSIIYALMGSRDPRVSYRIGTRPFAWREEKTMFGTSARLEKRRNFLEIDIDTVLRRGENRRTWVFPRFAEDIFERRIRSSPYTFKEEKGKTILSQTFGKQNIPDDRAREYTPNAERRYKVLKIEAEWPEAWKDFLLSLAIANPLEGRLAEAWCRQKGKQKVMYQEKFSRPLPWELKPYWNKERVEQALIQIASRNQQQVSWYGRDTILALSGGNILAFISLCRHIWDVWLRDNRNNYGSDYNLPHIDPMIQSIGIREASRDWFKELSEVAGGKSRQVFIKYIGELFHKTIVDDKPMSNPGHYGFSLSTVDLEKDPKTKQFLNTAVDFGDLYSYPHTSKLKDKKERIKWYLNPILSPHFKIPCVHIKEPMYVTIEVLNRWIDLSVRSLNG